MGVGVIYDPVYLEHDTGEHPENARRLAAVTQRLKETGIWDELKHISPRPATLDELELAHSESLVSLVRQTAQRGGGMMDADTIVSPASYKAALYAAGGTIEAVKAVMAGAASSAFALVRPPGHHATRSRSMGFCLFNNAAIAAAYALKNLGVGRLLILDWDVHHGNGVQDIFQNEPHVFYISLHQWPHYPGTGRAEETGAGNIVNIPMPAGSDDAAYAKVMDEIVAPLARRFQPELMLASVGFDGHWTDPLASMRLSITGYEGLMRQTLELAQELCGGRLALTLEGGYNLIALADGVTAVFNALMGYSNTEDRPGPPPPSSPPDITELIRRIREIHRI
jgi:acetoin utilization deacetylase AcuC-like enzyme